MLAPSAFLASAASTFQLQQSILPDSISPLEDRSLESIQALGASQSNSAKPAAEVQHIQKAWDGSVVANHRSLLLTRAVSDVDTARLLAASSPHSVDWLHAPPITAVGMRLSDEAIRVAVAHRLGCKACEPHTCVCGKPVDARGLLGLSCCKSAPRQQRYSHINDIIWRAIKPAQVPAVKEPMEDNKRPDGTTLLPWTKRKRWFGMPQSQTSMQSHTSLTQCPPQGRQLIKRHNTRLPSIPSWQAHTCSTPLP